MRAVRMAMSLTASNGVGDMPSTPAMPRGFQAIVTRAEIASSAIPFSRAIRCRMTGMSAAKAAARKPVGVGPAFSPPAPPAKPAGSSDTRTWPLLSVMTLFAPPLKSASAQFSRRAGISSVAIGRPYSTLIRLTACLSTARMSMSAPRPGRFGMVQ